MLFSLKILIIGTITFIDYVINSTWYVLQQVQQLDLQTKCSVSLQSRFESHLAGPLH